MREEAHRAGRRALERQLIYALEAHLAGQPASIVEAGRLAWRWFLDLCRTRTRTGFGPNPISFVEIEAYARLYRWPLEAHHVDLILAMDRVWMAHAASAFPTGNKSTAARRPSSAPITPALFDAVFP